VAIWERLSIQRLTACCRTYKAIVDATAKKDYRPDLRAEAIARASAIKRSQRPVRAEAPVKLRGAKAKKAKEAAA